MSFYCNCHCIMSNPIKWKWFFVSDTRIILWKKYILIVCLVFRLSKTIMVTSIIFSTKNTIFSTSHLHWAKRSVIKSKSLLINIKNRIQANKGRMGYRGRGESRFCLAIMHIRIKAVYVVSNLDRFGKKKEKRTLPKQEKLPLRQKINKKCEDVWVYMCRRVYALYIILFRHILCNVI